MRASLTFRVHGIPAPQGSHTAVTIAGRARVIPAGGTTGRARLRDWRSAVADAAAQAATTAARNGDDIPLDGPLALLVEFRHPMPASRPAKTRTAGIAWKPTAPDTSKLLRATEDALIAGGLIRDDARIVLHLVRKTEVIGWTGANIAVTTIASPPQQWPIDDLLIAFRSQLSPEGWQ